MKTKNTVLWLVCAIYACSIGYGACTEKSRDKISDPCSHKHWISSDHELVQFSNESCSQCSWPSQCYYKHWKTTIKEGNLTEWKITYCEESCPEEAKCLGMYVNINERYTYEKNFWRCAW